MPSSWPAEKWGHPDAWEIRKDAEREREREGRKTMSVQQGATRSFAGPKREREREKERMCSRSSLLSNLLAQAVFSAEK